MCATMMDDDDDDSNVLSLQIIFCNGLCGQITIFTRKRRGWLFSPQGEKVFQGGRKQRLRTCTQVTPAFLGLGFEFWGGG
jgi:hypothetical protein